MDIEFRNLSSFAMTSNNYLKLVATLWRFEFDLVYARYYNMRLKNNIQGIRRKKDTQTNTQQCWVGTTLALPSPKVTQCRKSVTLLGNISQIKPHHLHVHV